LTRTRRIRRRWWQPFYAALGTLALLLSLVQPKLSLTASAATTLSATRATVTPHLVSAASASVPSRSGHTSPLNQLRAPTARIGAPSNLKGGATRAGGVPVHGLSVVTGFQGVSHGQERTTLANQDSMAPDVDLAVGVNQIVQTANSTMTVWDRTGHQLGSTVSLNTLFGAPAPTPDGNTHITRTSVVYDASSQRFLMTTALPDSMYLAPVWLAVSQTSDATGNWWVSKVFESGDTVSWAAPSLATSTNKVAVTFRIQNGPYPPFATTPANGAVIVDKPAAGFNGTSWSTAILRSPNGYPLIAARDATQTSTALYFAEGVRYVANNSCLDDVYSVAVDGAASTQLEVLVGVGTAISVGPPSSCDVPPATIPQPSSPTVLSPDVVQSGTGGQIGRAPIHAVWQNGELYVSSTISCPDNANVTRICLLVDNVDTDFIAPPVNNAFSATISLYEIGSPGAYWWAPAIALDSHGNLYFSSYEATASQSPDLVVSASEVGASVFDPTRVLATSDQTPNIGAGTLPYGLSTAAVLDPTDPTKMWVTGEYYTTGSQTDLNALPWTTAIEEVQLPTASTLTDNFQHVYTLDGWGGVHPDASSPPVNCPGSYWPNWDIARGFSMTGDGLGGYILDGWGGIHPCGNAPAVSGYAYWPGWDIARGIALRADGHSGYVLDGWGGVHAFGGAPPLPISAYWRGWDIARGIVLDPDGGGGYVLDGWGGLHPFGNAPAVTITAFWRGWDIARGIALNNDGTGGYVLDGHGNLHPFGNAPLTQVSAAFNRDLARGVVMWSQSTNAYPGGWVLDGWGGIWPFGYAPDVARGAVWPGWDIARSISGAGEPGGGRRA
jgi:hypothetical protein